MTWQALLGALGGLAALVGAITWIVRTGLTHWLDRRLREQERRHKLEADQELEALKSRLQRGATEHSVVFTELHAKRSAILAELHERIVTTRDAFRPYLSSILEADDETIGQLGVRAFSELSRLSEFFERKATLYLEPRLSDSVGKLIAALLLAGVPGAAMEKHERKAASKLTNSLMDQFVPPILKELETEFRQLLGVPTNAVAMDPLGG